MLNDRQKEAVDLTEGPLLILAGAGAGKTKTVTHRILNLISKGTNPRNILAITFTNKAAKEMRERVDKLLSEDKPINRPISVYERPFVSTFHALGVHIIKEQAQKIGLTRHFTIYDRSDSKRAIKDAVESLSLDPKQFEPGIILNTISREKGDGVTNSAYRVKIHDYFSEVVANVWDKYEATLKKEKSLDFDDLLLKAMLLLKNLPEVREYYSSLWKYIHVDEYQDTNKVQYDMVRLLAEKNQNICVVGDIDQNIYSWRGATIHNILNFEKDYPAAKIILLEENYRSTQTILNAANNVIEKNKLRRDKTLFTKNGEGEKIDLTISYTEADEAQAIVEKIMGIIATENGKRQNELREIAVLYRANFQSRAIEEAFLKNDVPYQILGTKFFDRKEVKDVLSFIRASLNRESTADMVRIINVPPRGIGKATMLKVLAGQTETLGPALKMKVNSFLALLDKIKKIAETETPSMLVKYVMRESGLEKALKDGTAEDQEKLENLRELVSVAAQYDNFDATVADEIGKGNTAENMITTDAAISIEIEEIKMTAIEKLLENASLATDQDELEKDNNAVKLMTVHASKGLEFDYVFITGLEEDLFPHKRLNEGSVTQAEEEEERRLFYVAITRARKKVFLSWAQIRTIFGSQKVNTPSQFITDIGTGLIEEGFEDKPVRRSFFINF
jgi:DNA helicase-2/ATP-dependent DNA helicase PcrA